MKNFASKMYESLISVAPIAVIITVLNFSLGGMPALNFVSFLIGVLLLLIGMALYSIGSASSMEPIGEHIGDRAAASNKIWFILLTSFTVGLMVTMAEPDLTVLATQISSIPNMVLITSVGIGVGVFMLVAVLRLMFRLRINYLFIILYSVVFLLAYFVSDAYVPLAFDSGGVTTGPITVPFVLTFGVGISGALGGARSQEDSFGMVGICSVGPVLAVLILGLLYRSEASAEAVAMTDFRNFADVLNAYFHALPEYFKEVGIAISPIVIFFLIFQFASLKLPAKSLAKIIVGIIYTYIGLTLFLTGANVGFMQAGSFIGDATARSSRWLPVLIGIVVGAFLVLAEPAVHTLNKQVEEITGGAIKRRTMLLFLAISMSIAVGLSMVRVVTGISIWYIILPVYVLALGISFFVPKLFTAIAFDSGGVASGPMTSTFLLPFAMGASAAFGGNIMTDAFGIVAFVAMTPLISIQIMGIIYKIRNNIARRDASEKYAELLRREGEIISLEEREI